jgi:Ca2+-binding RTX toxin-like protein
MDLDEVERIDVAGLGGTDRLNVDGQTDLEAVSADLAGVLGGTGGDGAADEVIVDGSAGRDVMTVTGAAGSASVLGLDTTVQISNAESATDTLRILAGAGDDVVDASQLAANAIGLVVEGGDEDDVLLGGSGDDTLLGQADDDVLIGGPGLDVLDGGAGNNVLLQD